jgi:hypothetical protein
MIFYHELVRSSLRLVSTSSSSEKEEGFLFSLSSGMTNRTFSKMRRSRLQSPTHHRNGRFPRTSYISGRKKNFVYFNRQFLKDLTTQRNLLNVITFLSYFTKSIFRRLLNKVITLSRCFCMNFLL